MRTLPLSARPALQVAAPSTQTVLPHGSRVSLLVVSLMLAFPGSSHAGGAAGVNSIIAPAGSGGGAGAGYSSSGIVTFGGANSVNGTAPGGSAGGGAGGANSAGGGGGGIGSTQNSPGGLASAVKGGAGGVGTSGGSGGGGDGVVLGSGGTVNVNITGGAGGASTAGLSGGGGGGAGIVYTPADDSLTIGSAVTGGVGGNASQGGGGGGSGVWVTSNGAVNVTTTGIVMGGNGGTVVLTTASQGAGGAGIVLGSTGGQLQVDGQVLGGTTSGSGIGGAGVNILAGGGTVTVDNGGVIAGGAGGQATSTTGLGSAGGAGSGGAVGGNTKVAHTGAGGVGIAAAGGGNTIVTGGAINGGMAGATQANAITFIGLVGNNSLELLSGYSFTGDVMAGGPSNHLVLGGDTSPTASFDVSRIGAALGSNTTAYTGFSSFQKTGASTWTLAGTTTAVTPWTVSGGTLSVSSDGALGDTSGVLTLDGGTLQNTATFTTARKVTLTANGGTLDTTGADLTMSGSVSGPGVLTKEGDGSLILTGLVLSGISITQGTVQVGNGGTAGSIAGDVATSTGTTLAFDRSDTYTSNGAMSGDGALGQIGTGTLVLTGANSYSGNTTISSGVLQVGAGGTGGSLGTGAVIDNAALVFNRSDAPTVANVISGSGSVAQSGSGNLILTGANLYTGPTVINSGTLTVDGSIVSDTTVNNGGTLGGSGTVGNVNVTSGGVLAPDNASGMLHVNGNLNFNAGAIYRVQADAAGNADRTDVTGNLALAGTVDVQAGAGSYAPNTSYTILTDTGTQTGTFSGVTSNLAFLTPTLSYQPNAVMLNLARNNVSFADVAATNNQRGVANALQNAATGASGDIGTMVNAVTNLSADQARAAFDAMGGAGLTSMRRANLSFVNGFDNQVRARLNVVGASADGQQAAFDTPVLLAANDQVSDLMPLLAQQSFSLDGGVPSAAPESNRGLWLRGYGSDQSTAGDANAAGSRQKDAGISAGFDARVDDNWVVGVALTHDHADVDAADQNGNSNGNAVALYGSYASGPWNVNGVFSYAHNSNGTQRGIAFGDIDRTATADFGSRTVSLYGDVTYDVPLAGWTLQPLAGLSLSSNLAAGYSETGADALNLQIASQTVQSTKSLFGAKALINVDKVQLQPRLIWAHEFSNVDSAAMTAQLQGAPTPFAINGVDVPRDSLIAGLTVSGQASERVAVFADVQEEFNAAQNKLGLLLGMRASW